MGIREQIFAIDDIKLEKVNVPDWSMDVWVKGLTAAEKDAYELSGLELQEDGSFKQVMKNMRAKLVVQTSCDEKKNRIFKDDDIGTLGRKSGNAVGVLFDVAQRLSGLGKYALEDALKNLKSVPAEDLPSD
jgi:hypothetical protein